MVTDWIIQLVIILKPPVVGRQPYQDLNSSVTSRHFLIKVQDLKNYCLDKWSYSEEYLVSQEVNQKVILPLLI